MPTSVRAPFERLPGFLDREAERDALDGLLRDVRSGHGRTLVVRGEAGVGKSALLEYMVEGAADMQVVRALGVESEMELAFASVHLLLAPLLDRVQELPGPHISSVRVQARKDLGKPAGRTVDRFSELRGSLVR